MLIFKSSFLSSEDNFYCFKSRKHYILLSMDPIFVDIDYIFSTSWIRSASSQFLFWSLSHVRDFLKYLVVTGYPIQYP